MHTFGRSDRFQARGGGRRSSHDSRSPWTTRLQELGETEQIVAILRRELGGGAGHRLDALRQGRRLGSSSKRLDRLPVDPSEASEFCTDFPGGCRLLLAFMAVSF